MPKWETPELIEWNGSETRAPQQPCYPKFICSPRVCSPLWCYPTSCAPVFIPKG